RAQRELDALSRLIDVQKHLKEFIFVEYPGRFWWSPSSRLKNVELSSLSNLLDTLLQHVSKSLMYLSIVMTAETTTTTINAIEKYHLDLLELTIKLDQSHFFALKSCPFYNCPRLNKLVLSSWGYVEILADAILPQLGKSLPPSVEHLEILAPWMFTLRTLNTFLDNCKAPLRYFDIRYCRGITDQHVNLIWKRLYNTLENLIISERDPPSSVMDVDEQTNSDGLQDKNYVLDNENTHSGSASSNTENESRNYQTIQVSNE
ncbi:19156_t:CDS:2, partial [Racocetra fulgida]